ncbi:MAG: prephenate dehydrogenase [Bellilinea sp.]
MTVNLSVIGLNQIGVSIGLAIQAGSHPITRIGSDLDIGNERKALKMGAFDQVVHNLHEAVENADIVVLCLPVDDTRKTLEVIAQSLKPGAVVFDTSVLKSAAQNWAASIFSEDRHFISFYPNLNPAYLEERAHDLDNAHEDLFKKSIIMIGASDKTHPDAVKLAADFASLLGARPFFSDLAEAEGLTSLVHHLPQASAVALYHAIEGQSGWREGRKIAGTVFLEALSPLVHMDERKDFGQAMLLNSENTVRVIDAYIEELRRLREMIARQDAETLQKTIESAVDGRISWLHKRQTQDWEHVPTPQLPTSGQWLGKLFTGGSRLRDLDKPKK